MDHLYFFGRFNFPHYGYLYVIRESLQKLHPAHGITIIPSVEHATWGKEAISFAHRKAMFSLAIKELPHELQSLIHISSIEYDLQKKQEAAYTGFTIDTLKALQKNPTHENAIVMGADAAIGIPGVHPGFTAWKDWEQIQDTVSLVVVPRGRYPNAAIVRKHLPKELHAIVLSTKPSTIELHASSTAIQAGSQEFLPKSVYAYAVEHGLLIQY